MRTVLDIINIAKVSEYLFMNSIQVKALYGGGTDLGLPYKIYNVRRSVEWAYYYQPQSPTTQQKNELVKSANYLYSLCVAMALRAEDIVNEGKTITLTWTDLESAQMWLSNLTGSGNLNDVNNWNIAFDLPANGSPFSSVSISNSTTIVLRNFGNINTTPYQLFVAPNISSPANKLISIVDTGVLLHIGDSCFFYNTGLISASFAEVVELDSDSPFAGCENLATIQIPKLAIIGYGGFQNTYALSSVNFPLLTTLGFDSTFQNSNITSINAPLVQYIPDNCFVGSNITTANFPLATIVGASAFESCYQITTIDLSSCTNLGGTTGNNFVFTGIIGRTITLTVPAALMTCNGGNPDGDIIELQANNTVTIIEV